MKGLFGSEMVGAAGFESAADLAAVSCDSDRGGYSGAKDRGKGLGDSEPSPPPQEAER